MKTLSFVIALSFAAPVFAAQGNGKEKKLCRDIQEQVNLLCVPSMDFEDISHESIIDCKAYYLEQYIQDPEILEKCHVDYANPGNWFNKPSKPYRLRDK